MVNQEQKSLFKKYEIHIKTRSCLVCGTTPVDAHHLDAVGMGGANKSGIKDLTCVPLCRIHHGEYHSYGLNKFETHYNINLWRDALYLLRRFFLNEIYGEN